MNLNEYKVLKLLSKPIFFRELSKKSGVSIGGTQQVLKNYSGFIEKKTEGKNTYYSLKKNLETLYLKKIIELQKAQIFLKNNPRFKELFNYFVKNNIYCLVFGSYAKGSFNKGSDVDVLVLGVKKNFLKIEDRNSLGFPTSKKNSVGNKKFPEHLCPVKVHSVCLAKSQFETASKKKETLINEIINNHIIINGVDYFTNILE